MTDTTTALLPQVADANLDDPAAFWIDDKNGNTRQAAVSQVRKLLGLPVLNILASPFNAKDDNSTNNTAAFALARTVQRSTGCPIFVPPTGGIFRTDAIDATGTEPFALHGGGFASKIQLNATSAIGLALGQATPGQAFCSLRDFQLSGTSSNAGGIALGTSATYPSSYYTNYGEIRGLWLEGFSKSGAYALSLNSVQELNVEDCWIYGNYNNIVRPTGGYLTSTKIHGMRGYIGGAANIGLKIVGGVGSLFVSDIVIESNVGGGIIATPDADPSYKWHMIVERCHVEGNGVAGLSFTGADGTHPMRLMVRENTFGGQDTGGVPTLSFDYVANAAVRENHGLCYSGGIATTTHSKVHFADNANIDDGGDYAAVYAALSGTITAEDWDTNGERFTYGQIRRLGLPTSNAGLVSGEEWYNTNVRTVVP